MIDKLKTIFKRSWSILPICLGFYLFTYRQVLNDYGTKELVIYTLIVIFATLVISTVTYYINVLVNKKKLKKLGIVKEDNHNADITADNKEVSDNNG